LSDRTGVRIEASSDVFFDYLWVCGVFTKDFLKYTTIWRKRTEYSGGLAKDFRQRGLARKRLSP